MEKTFRKDLGSLEDVFAFVTERMGTLGVDAASAFAINLAVEEFFTNMVKYSSASRNDVVIAVDGDGAQVTVALIDTDVDRFDVTEAPAPHLSAPPGEWQPGGLGLYLTRNLIDSVKYHYENRTSIITFTKTLQRPHVHD